MNLGTAVIWLTLSYPFYDTDFHNLFLVAMVRGSLVVTALVLVAWSCVVGPWSALAQGNGGDQNNTYGGNDGDGGNGDQGAYTPAPSPTYGGDGEEGGE